MRLASASRAALVAALAALAALAAPALAATGVQHAEFVTAPAGLLVLPTSSGDDVWVADRSLGLCRLDQDPIVGTGGIAADTCVPGPLEAGQPAFDAAQNLVYVPDVSPGSTGVWRFAYDPASRTIGNGEVLPVTTLPDVTLGRPAAVAVGAPVGGFSPLYVAYRSSGRIDRLVDASANGLILERGVAQTTDGSGVASIVAAEGRVHFAEATKVVAFDEPASGAQATLSTVLASVEPIALAADGATLYVAEGVTHETRVLRVAGGAVDVFASQGIGYDLTAHPFPFATALGARGALFVGFDPAVGVEFDRGAVYRIALGDAPEVAGSAVALPLPLADFRLAEQRGGGLPDPRGVVQLYGSEFWVADGALGLCRGFPGGIRPGYVFDPALDVLGVAGYCWSDVTTLGQPAYYADLDFGGGGLGSGAELFVVPDTGDAGRPGDVLVLRYDPLATGALLAPDAIQLPPGLLSGAHPSAVAADSFSGYAFVGYSDTAAIDRVDLFCLRNPNGCVDDLGQPLPATAHVKACGLNSAGTGTIGLVTAVDSLVVAHAGGGLDLLEGVNFALTCDANQLPAPGFEAAIAGQLGHALTSVTAVAGGPVLDPITSAGGVSVAIFAAQAEGEASAIYRIEIGAFFEQGQAPLVANAQLHSVTGLGLDLYTPSAMKHVRALYYSAPDDGFGGLPLSSRRAGELVAVDAPTAGAIGRLWTVSDMKAPVLAAQTTPTDVALTGHASGEPLALVPGAFATFFDGGGFLTDVAITVDGQGSFEYLDPLFDLVHHYTVQTSDGDLSVSPPAPPVTVVVDTLEPFPPTFGAPRVVGLTARIVGQTEPGATVQLDGPAGVTFLPATATADWRGEFSFLATFPQGTTDGLHTLTAGATDVAGNGPATAAVDVAIDTLPPAQLPAITSHADGAVVSGTITIVASVPEGVTAALYHGPAGARTLVQQVPVTGATVTFAPIAGVTAGSHVYAVTAADAAGNETSAAGAQVTLRVDDLAGAPAQPLLAALAPITRANPLVVTGRAEPGSTVFVRLDGNPAATVTAGSDGRFTASLADVPEGTVQVSAVARDAAGLESTPSAPATVRVDRTAPAAPVVSTPLRGSLLRSSQVSFTGTAEAGATVVVSLDGVAAGEGVAGSDGAWTVTAAVPLGTHSASVAATDAAGNASAATELAFTVEAPVTKSKSGGGCSTGMGGGGASLLALALLALRRRRP